MLRLALIAVPVALTGCSSPSAGTLELVSGGEADPFTQAPAPVTLTVESVDSSGNQKTLATASLPATQVDLGSVDVTATGTLQVTATDASGIPLVYGQSMVMSFGALDGVTVPIFVQRTGELARMPQAPPLSDARSSPTLAVIADRYLFIGAGSDPSLAQTSQLYDFGSLSPLSAPPTLPREPLSVVFFGEQAWLINDHDSGVSGFDFSQNAPFDVTPPAGGSLVDVAGGETISASDGSQYVVGATRRTGTPTKTVLFIDATGQPSWASLSAPRLGAAAAWVDGTGLVVAAGSDSAAGVEVLGTGATTGIALDYPFDAAVGSGAAALDGQHVLLAAGTTPAGDDAGVRSVDLSCSAQCMPTLWAALPRALMPAQAFVIDKQSDALLVGDDPSSGDTLVFRLGPDAAPVQLLTKASHTGARAILSPLGSVVLFGGGSLEIESFFP